jgi:glutathione S-transferase
MSKPVIIGFPQSSFVWTARSAANQKGVEHDFQPLTPPESKEAAHLERHPWGKVPAFSHGDVSLYETIAICSYIDTAFEGPALQPSEPLPLARMHQAASIVSSYLYPSAVTRYILQYIFPSGPDGAPNREVIDGAIPDVRKTLEVLDKGVSGKWYCGDDLTLADLFVGPFVFSLPAFPEGPSLFEGLDNLGRLKGQLVETPSFMSAAPPPPPKQ